MESPGRSEWMHKPELDKSRPAHIFEFAKNKQQWINERVHATQRPYAIDHLSEELDGFVAEVFETMPEIEVTALDVHYSRSIEYSEGCTTIQTSPLPFEGDAEVFGEHTLRGTLHGFHRGDDGDLRMYISLGDEEKRTMGGVYMPLLSIGVATAEIQLAQEGAVEQLDMLKKYISEHTLDAPESIRISIVKLYDVLAGFGDLPSTLREASLILADIARNEAASAQIVDALLECIKQSAGLSRPHDVTATSHRVIITREHTRSYQSQVGLKVFKAVIGDVGLIGETAHRGLGLLFLNNDSAVQIPVQYITNMHISK